ncbi:TetR/AcrR family transcriptional regulator [Actinomadura sp. 3N407]|uniref:TetR/AcrR family transcriptional regulator n=1 Tax=Actinomadura sp. 3N407 TaxID=3457423 RepID=UPI003FCE5992
MSQRERQKAESRQRIVRSAVNLLRERGLADVSVSEVMAGAGLTVGGFYAHFPSKGRLAEEAVRQAMLDRREQFLDRPDEDGWRLRLQSAMQGYFSERHRDDVRHRCPMPMAAIDAARDGSAATVFTEEMAEMAKAFEAGADPTGPRAPRDAALGSLALMVGGMILAHATRGTPLSGEFLESVSRFGAAAVEDLEEQV